MANPMDIQKKIVLSLGGGVQSTALALMLDRRLLSPMPDIAIFADTGAEPSAVYANVTWLSSEIANYPIVWTRGFQRQRGYINLLEDVRDNVEQSGKPMGGGAIPWFTKLLDDSPAFKGRRQCTSAYKIKAIEAAARFALFYERKAPNKAGALYGGARLDPRRRQIIQLLGISADEPLRVKPNQHSAITNAYPLIDAGYNRAALANWFRREYPGRELKRSACYFCPYRSASEWLDIRDNEPALFADAIRLDASGRGAAITNPKVKARYLHRRRIPLAQAVREDAAQLAQGAMQYDFGAQWLNECEGHCGL